MKTILIIFFLFLSFNTFGETTKRDLTKHDNFIYWKNEAYSVDSVEKELRLKCGIQWFKVSFNKNEFDGSLASGKVVELNEKTMKINRGQGDKEIVEIFRFDNLTSILDSDCLTLSSVSASYFFKLFSK